MERIKATFIQLMTVSEYHYSEELYDDVIDVIGVDFPESDIKKLTESNGKLMKNKRKFFDYQIQYKVTLVNTYEDGINYWKYELHLKGDSKPTMVFNFFGDSFEDFHKVKAMKKEEIINYSREQRLKRILI